MTSFSISCAPMFLSHALISTMQYTMRHLHASLVNLSINNYYAESGMKLLSIGAGRRLPSGSWVRDRVSYISEEQVNHMMHNASASMLQTLSKFGTFNALIIAALDYHKIPRYDKATDEKL